MPKRILILLVIFLLILLAFAAQAQAASDAAEGQQRILSPAAQTEPVQEELPPLSQPWLPWLMIVLAVLGLFAAMRIQHR